MERTSKHQIPNIKISSLSVDCKIKERLQDDSIRDEGIGSILGANGGER